MTATVRGISVDERGGSINKDGHREYRITYKVQTDSKSDGAAAVRTAFGIPNLGDAYNPGNDSDSQAVVISKEPNQVPGCPFEWEVEVVYSTDVGEKEPKQYSTPLDEPPDISFGFQERRILIPGRFNDPGVPDPNGNWQNGMFAPNGELFDPQPEANYADPVWTIKRNVQNISYPTFMALANCVNSDIFQGVNARQLQLKPPTAVRKWHKAIDHYWEVSYQLVFRWETWDIQVLNQGTYYWASGVPAAWWGSTGLRSVKKDASGCPLVINLTTAGNINNTQTPTFTRIRYYREIIFSNLNLL